MVVFRIEREKYLEDSLNGIGVSITGGRWNNERTALVYTSDSRALASLEVAMHLDLSEDLPIDRFYVEIEIPDDIQIAEISNEDLPEGWDSKPPIEETSNIGDAFVKQRETAVLKVPSSIIPPEFNYLINPNHPDAYNIKVIRSYPFNFDPRLKT
ncbi:RES family NAD+ phosphorylase [Plebeiibacterium marinum]|uniref:RES family NAD+ phosphorylase n=1 Tax=Plebeiibacterium marinum TaxID=2992111 RepID=A0AAE3MBD5_9BACT|nr:RES family NAD+ phosphorylase [Plebeiobacterium marinum]MCW3804331.1 RES family NAD+ phosphorylase [Plebeiobacterium marinum]